MNELALTILAETADDAAAIARLHERTFGPGRFARTAYRLREKISHCLELSFTARIGTLLVGSVQMTRIRIGETPALLLGPLTVDHGCPIPGPVPARVHAREKKHEGDDPRD